MINFHSKSYFVSLHLWRHAHAAARGWISMTMMEMILGEEEDDDASDDSVCYVDHSYSISQRFFRTVKGV